MGIRRCFKITVPAVAVPVFSILIGSAVVDGSQGWADRSPDETDAPFYDFSDVDPHSLMMQPDETDASFYDFSDMDPLELQDGIDVDEFETGIDEDATIPDMMRFADGINSLYMDLSGEVDSLTEPRRCVGYLRDLASIYEIKADMEDTPGYQPPEGAEDELLARLSTPEAQECLSRLELFTRKMMAMDRAYETLFAVFDRRYGYETGLDEEGREQIPGLSELQQEIDSLEIRTSTVYARLPLESYSVEDIAQNGMQVLERT